MSRRQAAQQSVGNEPVSTNSINTPSNSNLRETRSQKRKSTATVADNSLNTEQNSSQQSTKRTRRQKKDSTLRSPPVAPTPQPSKRRKAHQTPASVQSQPEYASLALQRTPKTPTLNPRHHEMTNTPSNLGRSPALLTANTFKPTTAPGARLSMNTTRMARRGGPVLIPSDDEDADHPFSNQSQIRQEYKNAQEDDSNGESDPNLDFEDAEMLDRDFMVGTIGAALNQHGSDDIERSLSSFEGGDDVPNRTPVVTKKVQRMTAKLAGELPVVTPNHEETKPPASMLQSIEPTWLPHTSLVLKPSSDASWSHKLDLKSQNPQIRSVVKAATRQASLEVVINGSECPLHTAGLNAITLKALIMCADELGFDADLDISHRLEDGDHTTYVQPLMKYVALRVIIERKTLKTGFSSVVLAAFGLDYSEESIEEAKRLVANSDYIYQLLPSGDYDYSRPFSHNVIDKYLSAALFSSTKYSRLLTSKKATIFRSSFPQKPLELELPKAMVAMAACVIHSILQDHAKSVEENFPPTGLHSLWTTFIAVLTNLETASRVNYHKLMHKLYLKSTRFVAPTQHGLSQDQILQRINLAAFAANGGDDSDSSPSELEERHGVLRNEQGIAASMSSSGADSNATFDGRDGTLSGEDDEPGVDGEGAEKNGKR
ncbi:hypothetical protein F5876DRAFT_61039 [Lentinula aff. lateritia]|uniref:Uncharacterized protein n=1 Tax=Lentinula aff. lateritia TaxID=2804960 RepID=A0ACC1UFT4_9AGAR|nr:hypothetical protein F5876DRAFT_61039 [Lentinula aff. lateritia]